MNPSLYLALLQQYFPSLVTAIVEKYNAENRPLPYYYRQFCRPEFSVDGKWQSVTVNNSLVAADIVALDSEIALKKRAAIGQSTGDIPKMGMKLALNEQELTNLDTLVARAALNGGANNAQIVAKLFQDVDRVIGGGYERIEAMFLEGLSTGVTVVPDSENVGLGVRVDFGYLAANAFTSTLPWSNVASTPFTDMQPMLDRASLNGDVVTKVLLDRQTLNRIAATNEGKQLWAASNGFYGANVPRPTVDSLNTATQAEYGFQFQIVERSVRFEKNGIQTARKPWKAGAVVAVTTDDLATLAYARLAEQDHPSQSAQYQLADNFMLISKFHETEPSLVEVTKMQARVVPVINNPNSIYTLDSTVTAS